MAKSSRVVVGIQSGLLFLAWALACVTLAGASDKPAVMKGSYWVKQGDDTYLNYWGSCTKSDDSSGGDAPSSGGEPSGGEPSGGDSPPAGFPSSGGDSPSSGGNRMLRLLQQGGHRRLSSWTCHSAKDVNKDQDRFRPMAGMAAMGWLFTTAYFVLTLAKLVPPLAPRLRTLDIAGLVAGGFAWMFSLACWGQGVDLYGVDNNHDAHHGPGFGAAVVSWFFVMIAVAMSLHALVECNPRLYDVEAGCADDPAVKVAREPKM